MTTLYILTETVPPRQLVGCQSSALGNVRCATCTAHSDNFAPKVTAALFCQLHSSLDPTHAAASERFG